MVFYLSYIIIAYLHHVHFYLFLCLLLKLVEVLPTIRTYLFTNSIIIIIIFYLSHLNIVHPYSSIHQVYKKLVEVLSF